MKWNRVLGVLGGIALGGSAVLPWFHCPAGRRCVPGNYKAQELPALILLRYVDKAKSVRLGYLVIALGVLLLIASIFPPPRQGWLVLLFSVLGLALVVTYISVMLREVRDAGGLKLLDVAKYGVFLAGAGALGGLVASFGGFVRARAPVPAPAGAQGYPAAPWGQAPAPQGYQPPAWEPSTQPYPPAQPTQPVEPVAAWQPPGAGAPPPPPQWAPAPAGDAPPGVAPPAPPWSPAAPSDAPAPTASWQPPQRWEPQPGAPTESTPVLTPGPGAPPEQAVAPPAPQTQAPDPWPPAPPTYQPYQPSAPPAPTSQESRPTEPAPIVEGAAAEHAAEVESAAPLPEQTQCPSCGQVVQAGLAFCGHCGSRLSG
jgi:hypothetical protein